MGWWKINSVERGQIDWESSGTGLANKVPGRDPVDEMYNGDGPADEMGIALDKIAYEYKEAWGRWPKLDELQACFNFVTGPARSEGTGVYIPRFSLLAERIKEAKKCKKRSLS